MTADVHSLQLFKNIGSENVIAVPRAPRPAPNAFAFTVLIEGVAGAVKALTTTKSTISLSNYHVNCCLARIATTNASSVP